jgi:hypothetical protein
MEVLKWHGLRLLARPDGNRIKLNMVNGSIQVLFIHDKKMGSFLPKVTAPLCSTF